MIRLKGFQKWALLLGVSLAFSWGVTAGAFEPYYLNGDKTYPMIQNTGGIYNDGATGLFLDLSSLTVEDVFEDGLQAKVKTLDVKSSKAFTESVIHVRYSVDGKAWALGQDGRWREIPTGTEDPAALVVYFMRQAWRKMVLVTGCLLKSLPLWEPGRTSWVRRHLLMRFP